MKHILIFIFFSLSFVLFGQNDTHPNFTQSQLDSALKGTKYIDIPSHFNSNGDKNTWDIDLKDLGDAIKSQSNPSQIIALQDTTGCTSWTPASTNFQVDMPTADSLLFITINGVNYTINLPMDDGSTGSIPPATSALIQTAIGNAITSAGYSATTSVGASGIFTNITFQLTAGNSPLTIQYTIKTGGFYNNLVISKSIPYNCTYTNRPIKPTDTQLAVNTCPAITLAYSEGDLDTLRVYDCNTNDWRIVGAEHDYNYSLSPLIVGSDTTGFILNKNGIPQDTVLLCSGGGNTVVDTRLQLSVVNDSLKIDIINVLTSSIIGTYYIDNVINKPQNIYKKCDGADLLNGDKVYEVKDLARQSGMGVTKQNGTDCLGNNDDFYDSALSSYTASKTYAGNNFANGLYSRVINGFGVTINGVRSVGSGYNNTESGNDNAVFGQNNNYNGVAIIGGGNSNNLSSTLYNGGAYVNGINNTGIGGHGSILSGQDCIGSFRSWVGGYLNKDLNSLWDNYLHGYGNTFTNTSGSFAHASQVSITDAFNCSALSSNQGQITGSSSSGVFGGQAPILIGTNSSFILGGEQGQEISNVNLGGGQLFSSVLLGGNFNKSYSSYQVIGGRYNIGSSNSPKSVIFGNDNKALYGVEQCLYGNGLIGNNVRFTAAGNYNLEWTQGEHDVYDQNDLNHVVGSGSGTNNRHNAITILKNSWINFNPASSIYSNQTQAEATPLAPFHVNTINSSGNADGGVLLARMTDAQRITIPIANLIDGIEIYCTDCVANDSSVGVKMVYQLSTTTWKKLW